MGLLGLGIQRGMESSQKMNKDQLKNKRRSAKSISKQFPEKIKLSDKTIDEQERAAFKLAFELKKEKEKKQKLIFIGILVCISLVVFILLFV